MEGNNTAPFEKGQRVVALEDSSAYNFKKGDEFTVLEIKNFCRCLPWVIDIGRKNNRKRVGCNKCGKYETSVVRWFWAGHFAPIERKKPSVSIDKEVLDSLPKITEERSDVKPQTVNN